MGERDQEDCILRYTALQDELVRLRRELHRIPEVGCELPETCAYVEAYLQKLGIPFRQLGKAGGVLAEIDTGRPGKLLLFRADMDALPVKEETGLSFASEHTGKMHACGHDAHTAMLLGAASVLVKEKEKLSGKIRLLFQTGEEVMAGAKLAISEGAMDPLPDAVFGIHIGSIMGAGIPSGTIIAASGCVMASCDRFIIRVKGKGCHGSTPEKGVDPILTGAQIVSGLQEILSREFSGSIPKVLTVGQFHAGFAFNVIPDEAVMEGTVRAVDEAVRQQIMKRIREIAVSIAAAYRAEAEAEIVYGAPPVVNDPAMAKLAAEAAEAVCGQGKVMTQISAPTMIGEDFALYLEMTPGAFLFLSSSDREKGTDVSHHNSRFNIDEDVLWKGAAVFTEIAERYLA